MAQPCGFADLKITIKFEFYRQKYREYINRGCHEALDSAF